MNTQVPARLRQPRIPYDPRYEKRFNISAMHWRLLVEQVFPSAKTAEGILLAVGYCKERQLDILKRPVHVVPIWDSQQNKEIESVWPGIGEHRITAARTRTYAGKDEVRFGPEMTVEFTGIPKKGAAEKTIKVTFPEWAEVTVYKMVDGQRCPFVGSKVYWLETYARLGKSDLPNTMWQKRSRGQLAKCAEAEALRAAYPEEIGDTPLPEEASAEAAMRDVTPPRPAMEDFAEDPQADEADTSGEPAEREQEQPAEDPQQEEAAAADDSFPGDKPMDEKQPPKGKSSQKAAKPAEKQEPKADETPPADDAPLVPGGPIDFLANWNTALRKCETEDAVNRLQRVNGKRIGEFDDELQHMIDDATEARKEELSQ